MMSRCIVLLHLMTLRANPVTGRTQCLTVGFMTITAHHARVKHLALHERAINKILIQNLAIKVVKGRSGKQQLMGGEQILSMAVGTQSTPPRMTATATIHLALSVARFGPKSYILFCRENPLTRCSKRCVKPLSSNLANCPALAALI